VFLEAGSTTRLYPDRCEIEPVIIETDSGSAIVLQWQ
jgi:hypothetical protein